MQTTSNPELFVRERRGKYRPATTEEIFNVAREAITASFLRHGKIGSPDDMRRFLIHHFAGIERESFVVIFLDAQHQVIAFEELSRGTIDAASVYPREVVRRTLHHNAAAVAFSHQHPSGEATPSMADRTLTDRLVNALRLIDVRVIDHFVVGGTSVVSFAERGWI